MPTCEVCHKPCDHDKGENETCSFCGLVVCQEHAVIDDRERPLCLDCGHDEAARQARADAPGVWPDWAARIVPDAGSRRGPDNIA
jgi:hypothetical protein